MRPSWKGHLRLSLVTIPLDAYPATTPGPAIPLKQLHECGSRIKYQKTCPIHAEVSNDEIVSGYQYGRGQYVVVESDELDSDLLPAAGRSNRSEALRADAAGDAR